MSGARRLLALLASCVGLGLAAAAAGAAPQRLTFDDLPVGVVPFEGSGPYAARGLTTPYAGCMTTGVYRESPAILARSSPQFLAVLDQDFCGGYLRMGLVSPLGPAAAVQFAIKGKLATDAPPTARVVAIDRLGAVVEIRDVPLGDWQLVTFVPPAGRPLAAIQITTAPWMGPVLLIDDVLVSTLPSQPAVTITSSPPATTELRTATIAFANNADTDRVLCSFDGAAAQPCSQSVSRSDLALGPHSLVVTAIDAFGTADPAPPTVRWTVVDPPLPPPSDPCVGEPDGDRDGVSDACDTVGLPAGTPTVPGERASVTVVSGEVFIKLPRGSASRAGATRAATEPDPGFVPLKGISVIPVGSTVDTRGGAVNVITATGASDKGAPKQATSKVASAIFQIRQNRALRKTKKRRRIRPSPTALILRNPEGAIQAARCADVKSHGTVRSLSATIPKGIVRVGGFASEVVAEQANTTLRVVDRCDGTFTEIGAGRAKVTVLARRRTVTVRRGQSYFVPGNLLRVEGRKGR